jgi:hypothetical protein
MDSPNKPIAGRVVEWLKTAVLKTARPSRASWVRIPPLPPSVHSKKIISALEISASNGGVGRGGVRTRVRQKSQDAIFGLQSEAEEPQRGEAQDGPNQSHPFHHPLRRARRAPGRALLSSVQMLLNALVDFQFNDVAVLLALAAVNDFGLTLREKVRALGVDDIKAEIIFPKRKE